LIYLWIDDEGVLWHGEHEVGMLGQFDHSFSEARRMADQEVIAEAIAESTEDLEGEYRIRRIETEEIEAEGLFYQTAQGVEIEEK
jgi:hypothetical protein